MTGYKKYKKAKLRGVLEVPDHWKPIKLKFIGKLYSGLSGKSGEDFYNKDHPDSKPYINFKNIATNVRINPKQFDLVVVNPIDNQNKVLKGDIFFLMSSENFEDIGKTSVLIDDLEDTYLNSFCRGYRIFDVNFDPVFLNYLLLSNCYRQSLAIEAKGFTRINIQIGKIQNFEIYAPFSLSEQFQIAYYLDHQTAIIDDLIKQKEKLIDLLKEKRQSVINEAVTQGLYTTAKMKDSRIEWLGKIPEKWKVVKLKFITELITDGAHISPDLSSSDFPFISTVDLNNGEIDWDNCLKTSTESYDYLVKNGCKPLINDVLYSKDGTIGKTTVIKEGKDFVVASSLIIIRPNTSLIESTYLEYLLRSFIVNIQIDKVLSGVALRRVSLQKFSNLILLLPPLDEQVDFLNKIHNDQIIFINTLGKLKLQIEKLNEYRQSIISEAVTGKIDLREWQSNPKALT